MSNTAAEFRRFRYSDFTMVGILLVLCAVFSQQTIREQKPTGAEAGDVLFDAARAQFGDQPQLAIVVSRTSTDDQLMAGQLVERIKAAEYEPVLLIVGSASAAKKELNRIAAERVALDAIATSWNTTTWDALSDLAKGVPAYAEVPVLRPESYYWPDFLKRDNLRNIADQIAVIALIAIGMTMVIIVGGIDLSVGSLIALSAMVAAMLIANKFGARDASPSAMFIACLAAIAVCGLVGLVSGGLVTYFRMPSFIVTLGMMLAIRGLAGYLTDGASINELPTTFQWLGRDRMLGIPNSVILMAVLYLAAHFLMARTVWGRYLYAVGGNAEAARLAGVPVTRVVIFTFVAAGLLAGVGGIVMASNLGSASPTYGDTYELYVIAAVVVGGTSLTGGEGTIFGTLIGAFIIAVIRNGMNLMGIGSFFQLIVLGIVILVAVLIDSLKHRRRQ